MKNIFLQDPIVKDNAAIINPNTLVSITEVKPINLLELGKDEKLDLSFQYQYFLRSLAFPVQIVLRFVNKDIEKLLYRKRMANVEESIKEIYKKNYKDVLADCDEFRKWLRLFLELTVRPMLLCYFVVPVYSNTNLAKNDVGYVQALQLLNQRTKECISRLSSIKFRKKIKPNVKRSEWEDEYLKNIQEKNALIALKIYKKNSRYYSLNNFREVENAKRKVRDYIKKNFFDEIIDEKEISLELERLDDERISNLFDSYSRDFVVLNTEGHHKYLSVKDLFEIWVKPG
ncbi:MAG: hypothetical protein U9O94_07930 [Nanoarchaeota archaeon]|nr:hypothetical protein [Nanoarchaeota archaeon]